MPTYDDTKYMFYSADKKPDPSWPSKGAVRFDNMSLRYAEDQPPVLKNLDFSIQPTHKVTLKIQ